ncbi:unnamed protein product [Rodentolepis nana]|uniref:Cytospin-A n=1 Tax=Rodentolepis nana TaxID=102285 RepID=A0A0R3T831_RODNA|nr:unnamed protein product [Rodentolepis nana]
MGKRSVYSSSSSSTTTGTDSDQRSESCTDTFMSELNTVSEASDETPSIPTKVNRIKVKNFVAFTPNINLCLPEGKFANGKVVSAAKAQELLSSAMPTVMQSIEQCLKLANKYFKSSEASNCFQDMSKSHSNGNVSKVGKSANMKTNLVNGVKKCPDAKQTHVVAYIRQDGDAPKEKDSVSTSKSEESSRNFHKLNGTHNLASQRAMKNGTAVSNCLISRETNADEFEHGNGCNTLPLIEPSVKKLPTGISPKSIDSLKNGVNGFDGVKREENSKGISRHAANINRYLTYLQDKYSTRTCHPNEQNGVKPTRFEKISPKTGTTNSFIQPINPPVNGFNGKSVSQPKVQETQKTAYPIPPKSSALGDKAVNGISGNSISQDKEVNESRSIIWTTMARELWRLLFTELGSSNAQEIATNLASNSANANCS